MGDKREVLLLTLAENFVKNEDNTEHYNTFISALHEGQLLGIKKTSTVQDVGGEINSALNSSKRRKEGLCLLRQIVEQCSGEMFTQNAVDWLRLLTKTLQSYDQPVTLEMTCEMMVLILSHCTSFPELSREVATGVIPNLVPVLLSPREKSEKSFLHCLAGCMKYFHGPCGPLRNKIEAALLPYLDGTHSDLETVASECFALLPLCGGGGSQGVKHTESWNQQVDNLMGSLNDTLTALLQSVQMGIEDTPEPSQRLSLPRVPQAEPQHTCTLQARFSSLVTALCAMLSEDFPTVVKVPLDNILKVICRTLAVTPRQVLFHATHEHVLLCAVLPLLQQDGFRLLRSLITSCGPHLMVHGGTINKLFIQTLTWSAAPDTIYGHHRPYSGLRREVYETMSLWVQVLGASSGIETAMGDLMTYWLKDITAEQDTVKLEGGGQKMDIMESGSKKKRKKHGGGEVGQLKGQRKVITNANVPVCVAALQAMRQVVLRVGSFLRVKQHRTLHSYIVPLLMEIHQSAPNHPLPYIDATCRQALYQLLLAVVLCPHPNVAPPVQNAVKLFSMGTRDPDLQVSNTCTECLTTTEVLIHPRAPVLGPPALGVPMETVSNQSQNANVFGLGFYGGSSSSLARAAGGATEAGTSFANRFVFSHSQTKQVAPPGVVLVASGAEREDHHEVPLETSEDSRARDIEVVSLDSSDNEDDQHKELVEVKESRGGNKKQQEHNAEDSEKEQDVISIEDDDDVSPTVDDIKGVSADTEKGLKGTDALPTDVDKGSQETVNPSEDVVTPSTSASKSDCAEGSPEVSSGRKRKHTSDSKDSTESPSAKKPELDDAERMLSSFVDAGPDSD